MADPDEAKDADCGSGFSGSTNADRSLVNLSHGFAEDYLRVSCILGAPTTTRSTVQTVPGADDSGFAWGPGF